MGERVSGDEATRRGANQPEEGSAFTSGTRPVTRVGARQRLLVVDDEPLVLRVIARALAPHHDVVTETDPRRALALLAEQDFDVVLADMRMGDVWGGTFLDSVADVRPALKSRVAFLTGGVGEDEIDAFFAQVPNERLEKPFRTAELLELIARVVAKHPPER